MLIPNFSNVVKLLTHHFPLEMATEEFTPEESDLAHCITEFLRNYDFSDDALVSDRILNSEDEREEREEIEENSDEDYSTDEQHSQNVPPTSSFKYNFDIMVQIVHLWREEGWTFDRLRMERYIQSSVRLRLPDLRVKLYESFCQWMSDGHVIRDRDLKIKALKIAKELGMTSFKASQTFIARFKKNRQTVSRKVTRTATRRRFDDDQEQRQNSIDHFRTLARTYFADPDRYSKIYNTDQSGIQLELRGGRTLALKGTKQIQVLVQRENALTHSLTIQPAISASGEFQLPLLVCFQERKAPKKFNEELREFSHLHCVHSTSGMMSSELMKHFIREVFLPNGGDQSVLFVDCWNGYEKAKNEFRQNIEFLTFPRKTTNELQPLDLFCNRQIKAFYRRLTEIIIRQNPDYIAFIMSDANSDDLNSPKNSTYSGLNQHGGHEAEEPTLQSLSLTQWRCGESSFDLSIAADNGSHSVTPKPTRDVSHADVTLEEVQRNEGSFLNKFDLSIAAENDSHSVTPKPTRDVSHADVTLEEVQQNEGSFLNKFDLSIAAENNSHSVTPKPTRDVSHADVTLEEVQQEESAAPANNENVSSPSKRKVDDGDDEEEVPAKKRRIQFDIDGEVAEGRRTRSSDAGSKAGDSSVNESEQPPTKPHVALECDDEEDATDVMKKEMCEANPHFLSKADSSCECAGDKIDDPKSSNATFDPVRAISDMGDQVKEVANKMAETDIAIAREANDNPTKDENSLQLTSAQDLARAYKGYSAIAQAREFFNKVAGSSNLNTTMIDGVQERLDEISFVHHEMVINDDEREAAMKSKLENAEDMSKQLGDQVCALKEENQAISDELENVKKELTAKRDASEILAEMKTFISLSHGDTVLKITASLREQLHTLASKAESSSSEIMELQKKLEEMKQDLERRDEEKAALTQMMTDARREMLSFKCRYGLITKTGAVKELGDKTFKPPICLFTSAQVKQIKQWLSENEENTTHGESATKPNTPSVNTRTKSGRTASASKAKN
ncbi:hypothetical protein QR680_017287 [Steinernema hermaphroditum]|uniref:HTH CENPB-type domain-containing protein n=1 Tax=Steinernema hermaphroditum TaxID=289476 RepID=A0AA39HGE4_9BILA|nr:hypothetical protein QR680_017287 [Steinernema hermaphroditum]